jgi:hypothetical protein
MKMYKPFPTPNSPEWGEMNRRRVELIHKVINKTATTEEWREFRYLQLNSLKATDKEYTRPKLEQLELEQLEKSLESK